MQTQDLGITIQHIETTDAGIVPFRKCQLIIEDSGNLYYDPSTGSSESDRRLLNPKNTSRSSRVIIGLTDYPYNYTSYDADYLCTAEEFTSVLQTAIDQLPATGGEIILLDGTYTLNGDIQLRGAHVTIRGNGAATQLIPYSSSTRLINGTDVFLTLESLSFILDHAEVTVSSASVDMMSVVVSNSNQSSGVIRIQASNSRIIGCKFLIPTHLHIIDSNGTMIDDNTFINSILHLSSNACSIHDNSCIDTMFEVSGKGCNINNNIFTHPNSDIVINAAEITLTDMSSANFVHSNILDHDIVDEGTANILAMNAIAGETDYVSYEAL